MADIKISSFSTAQVAFECAWTGIFTFLHIGTVPFANLPCADVVGTENNFSDVAASIFVTLSGPPVFCDTKIPLSICASTIILVPISWLAATLRESFRPLDTRSKVGVCILTLFPSFQVLGYFVTILALCVSHCRVLPDLWSTPIYDIAWFDGGKSKYGSAPQLPPLNTSPIHLNITPPPLQAQNNSDANVENQQLRANPNLDDEKSLPSTPNVWWNRIISGRAGRDHPFAIRRPGEQVANHYYPSSSERVSSSTRRPDSDRPRVAAATLPYDQAQYGRGWLQQPRPRQVENLDVSPYRVMDPGPSTMVDVVLNEDEPSRLEIGPHGCVRRSLLDLTSRSGRPEELGGSDIVVLPHCCI